MSCDIQYPVYVLDVYDDTFEVISDAAGLDGYRYEPLDFEDGNFRFLDSAGRVIRFDLHKSPEGWWVGPPYVDEGAAASGSQEMLAWAARHDVSVDPACEEDLHDLYARVVSSHPEAATRFGWR